MTSKIVVNNIEPDAGVSTVTVNGDLQASNFVGLDASTLKNGSDVKVTELMPESGSILLTTILLVILSSNYP